VNEEALAHWELSRQKQTKKMTVLGQGVVPSLDIYLRKAAQGTRKLT
jgi:hypothetical protein